MHRKSETGSYGLKITKTSKEFARCWNPPSSLSEKIMRAHTMTTMNITQRRVRLDDVALEIARKNGRSCVWYGDPQLCQDIYSAFGGVHTHPLNTIATVISTLGRSPKWKRTGYIVHLGRKYPVYEPNKSS